MRYWIRIFVIFAVLLLLGAALLTLGGCAAPKSKEQRAILEWNEEGHHIYRKNGSIEYFVKCENGLKYIGYNVPATATQQGLYEVVGPVDACIEEEE